MIKRQSLLKNYAYQLLYQVLVLVIPLVLSPYLTRTLQSNALGIYTYVNSIAYYFVVAGMLGVSRHGQRIISQNCKDVLKLRKTFWSLFSVHSISSLLAIFAYLLFIAFGIRENRIVYLFETFYVISSLFDITWLFYGLENFKSVVIKNTTIKVLECVAIFAFVKSPNDLYVFTAISAIGVFLGQVVMVPYAVKTIKPIKFHWEDARQHVKPLFVFSISVIAVSLYLVFDKTLLGIMTTKDNVAFYEYANKIINVPKTIITVIGTVVFPRACKMAAEGNIQGQKKYMKMSFMITAMIGMVSLFGILAIADDFAVLYYGDEFRISGYVMKAMSPLIFIVGTGDVLRTQYMIPNHMDKQFNICILLNAIINIILSVMLIPIIGIYGAVIGTISAEAFGIIYQIICCKKFIKVREIAFSVFPFATIGLLMYLLLLCLKSLFFSSNSIIKLLLQVMIGGAFYVTITIIYVRVKNPEVLNILTRRSN